ncbi:MAG: 23S rRNA (pseudouridine(1915)-N(3))-methyltransferase RlmH [Pseudomonadota bacterium]
MKIDILLPFKIKKSFVKEGSQEYLKRIKRYSNVNVVNIKEEAKKNVVDPSLIMEKEATRINEKLRKSSFTICLSENGKRVDINKLEKIIRDKQISGNPDFSFVIGSAFGLDKELQKNAHLNLSISEFTLSHEMAFLVLTELLYRVFAKMNNEPFSRY